MFSEFTSRKIVSFFITAVIIGVMYLIFEVSLPWLPIIIMWIVFSTPFILLFGALWLAIHQWMYD